MFTMEFSGGLEVPEGEKAMSRLAREAHAFFSSSTLMGATALLAFLAGGIWILVSSGARSLLTAAAVYGACGIVAYVYLWRMKNLEPSLAGLVPTIFAWPFFVILHAYELMGWGGLPPRFVVTVGMEDIGEFRKWDEAIDCARQKADLGIAVLVSDKARRSMYWMDRAGRIERKTRY